MTWTAFAPALESLRHWTTPLARCKISTNFLLDVCCFRSWTNSNLSSMFQLSTRALVDPECSLQLWCENRSLQIWGTQLHSLPGHRSYKYIWSVFLLCIYDRRFTVRYIRDKKSAAFDAIASISLELKSGESFFRYLSLVLVRPVDTEMASPATAPGSSPAALLNLHLDDTYGAFFVGILISAMWVLSARSLQCQLIKLTMLPTEVCLGLLTCKCSYTSNLTKMTACGTNLPCVQQLLMLVYFTLIPFQGRLYVVSTPKL